MQKSPHFVQQPSPSTSEKKEKLLWNNRTILKTRSFSYLFMCVGFRFTKKEFLKQSRSVKSLFYYLIFHLICSRSAFSRTWAFLRLKCRICLVFFYLFLFFAPTLLPGSPSHSATKTDFFIPQTGYWDEAGGPRTHTSTQKFTCAGSRSVSQTTRRCVLSASQTPGASRTRAGPMQIKKKKTLFDKHVGITGRNFQLVEAETHGWWSLQPTYTLFLLCTRKIEGSVPVLLESWQTEVNYTQTHTHTVCHLQASKVTRSKEPWSLD